MSGYMPDGCMFASDLDYYDWLDAGLNRDDSEADPTPDDDGDDDDC